MGKIRNFDLENYWDGGKQMYLKENSCIFSVHMVLIVKFSRYQKIRE